MAPQRFSALVSLFRSLCPTCVQNASRMGTLTRFTDPLPSRGEALETMRSGFPFQRAATQGQVDRPQVHGPTFGSPTPP
jgi:hypothetical protein